MFGRSSSITRLIFGPSLMERLDAWARTCRLLSIKNLLGYSPKIILDDSANTVFINTLKNAYQP